MEKDYIKEKATTEYIRWINNISIKEQHDELIALAQNEGELLDSFNGDLKFGTSGLRGIIGMGTNRMNVYVVRRISRGIGRYLIKGSGAKESLSIVIAYDSRKMSKEFAIEAYRVFNEMGIKPYIFDEITPVSMLSYAITKLKCNMGIMITASHNPKQFNGYKVYNENGYQIVGQDPANISNEAKEIDYFEPEPPDCNVDYLDSSLRESFIEDICKESKYYDQSSGAKKNLRIVYTPLNGAGNLFIRQVLSRTGFENVNVVKVQEAPDENFTTCPSPNPENIAAYKEAFKIFDEASSDLIIATDPDSDRVGVALRHQGERLLLSGNQLGILLLDFMCHVRKPQQGQMMVKTIVSTPLVELISRRNGLIAVNTMVGFKYFGEIITNLEIKGHSEDYYFGFEESNGYLVCPFVKDKDGISAAMVVTMMAAHYKEIGKSLVQRLDEIYEEYGYCIDKTLDYYFEGINGRATIDSIMSYFRCDIADEFAGSKVIKKIDYLNEQIIGDHKLPKENVIQLDFDNGGRLIMRPSGTEAKVKAYMYALGKTREESNIILGRIENSVKDIINDYIKE